MSTEDHDFISPDHFWSGFATDLGDALGPRHIEHGLLRRDFTDGEVLLNEPRAPNRTVTFPSPMRNSAGALVTSVTLGGRQAAVLTAP